MHFLTSQETPNIKDELQPHLSYLDKTAVLSHRRKFSYRCCSSLTHKPSALELILKARMRRSRRSQRCDRPNGLIWTSGGSTLLMFFFYSFFLISGEDMETVSSCLMFRITQSSPILAWSSTNSYDITVYNRLPSSKRAKFVENQIRFRAKVSHNFRPIHFHFISYFLCVYHHLHCFVVGLWLL